MHYVIVVVPEITQKSRQHGSGFRLGVVQQDDPLAGYLQPVDQEP